MCIHTEEFVYTSQNNFISNDLFWKKITRRFDYFTAIFTSGIVWYTQYIATYI